jgi:hypothetical protein
MTTKTILRFSHDKETPYTIINNSSLNSKLSLKAMGLLTYMLSKPDDWSFSLDCLVYQLNEGRSSIKSAMKELEDKGHIVKKQLKDSRGLFSKISITVCEVPAHLHPGSSLGKCPSTDYPLTENPLADNPSTVCPLTENRPVLSNNNKPNNNLTNARSPDSSNLLPVAIAPSVCLEKINLEAGIQNTPPGGVDPVTYQKSSEGSSKPDYLPEDLWDEDPGYDQLGYDYSLEERNFLEAMAFEESCRNELSSGLEADRIKASRGDFMHAQAPLENPSETNATKSDLLPTCEGQILQMIEKDQETPITCLKAPAIDTSTSKTILRISDNDIYTKKPPKPSIKILEDNFAQWYAVYPKQVDKKKAISAFAKAMKRITYERLMVLTKNYALSVQEKNPQYLPHPSTWLDGDRWEDVGLEAGSGSSSAPSEPILQVPINPVFDVLLKKVDVPRDWLKNTWIEKTEEMLFVNSPSPRLSDNLRIYRNDFLEAYKSQEICFRAHPQGENACLNQ